MGRNMKYNFDEIISRVGTNSVKYESIRQMEPKLPENFIPMWIADMDFACAPPILEAMHRRIDRRIFGYSDILDGGYKEAVKGWMKKRFAWDADMSQMVVSSGVVPAIGNLIKLLTKPGEKIVIQTPSYSPFHRTILNCDRRPVYSPLIYKEGRYQMDLEGLEKLLQTEDIKLLIFCNPHNPTGRVWEEGELRELTDRCMDKNVPIISDEIHQDLIRKGHHHIPLARLYPKENRIYTCTAPSKTFNMAGNHLANIFIPDEEVKSQWNQKFEYLPNSISIDATYAAYHSCEDWVDELNTYLDENFEHIKERFSHMPVIDFQVPEGTYLAWFRLSKTGFTHQENVRKLIEEAGVCIEGGEQFVENGEGFIRLNAACPRAVLTEALDRIQRLF